MKASTIVLLVAIFHWIIAYLAIVKFHSGIKMKIHQKTTFVLLIVNLVTNNKDIDVIHVSNIHIVSTLALLCAIIVPKIQTANLTIYQFICNFYTIIRKPF